MAFFIRQKATDSFRAVIWIRRYISSREHGNMGLNYIIIGSLPVCERAWLKSSLAGVSEYRVVWLDGTGEAEKQKQEQKEWMERLEPYPPDESVLVSGCKDQIKEALHRNMTAVMYIPEEPCLNENIIECASLSADMYVEGFEEVDAAFLLRAYERHHNLPWTILETERCIVRELSLSDLDELFALYEGEGMTDYMEPLYEYEEEKAYQESYQRCMYRFYGYGMWLVFEKQSGKLIGRAGVEHRKELNGELELGYAIGVPYQRKGYAREVCTAILSYVRKELGFSLINCLIETGNEASVRLVDKLGFKRQGTVRFGGKDMLRYVLYLDTGK